MTREEALEELDSLIVPRDGEQDRLADALEMAMEALEQEPCEDAISRSEAIRVASGYCHWANIPKELAKLPSVTPQQKTGRWIEKEDWNGDTYYDCSVCGESFCLLEGTPTDNLYNYCPNCGVKMEVEE